MVERTPMELYIQKYKDYFREVSLKFYPPNDVIDDVEKEILIRYAFDELINCMSFEYTLFRIRFVKDNMFNFCNHDATALPPKDGATTLPPNDGTSALPSKDGATTLPPMDGAIALPPNDGSTALPPNDGAIALSPNDSATPLPPKDGLNFKFDNGDIELGFTFHCDLGKKLLQRIGKKKTDESVQLLFKYINKCFSKPFIDDYEKKDSDNMNLRELFELLYDNQIEKIHDRLTNEIRNYNQKVTVQIWNMEECSYIINFDISLDYSDYSNRNLIEKYLNDKRFYEYHYYEKFKLWHSEILKLTNNFNRETIINYFTNNHNNNLDIFRIPYHKNKILISYLLKKYGIYDILPIQISVYCNIVEEVDVLTESCIGSFAGYEKAENIVSKRVFIFKGTNLMDEKNWNSCEKSDDWCLFEMKELKQTIRKGYDRNNMITCANLITLLNEVNKNYPVMLSNNGIPYHFDNMQFAKHDLVMGSISIHMWEPSHRRATNKHYKSNIICKNSNVENILHILINYKPNPLDNAYGKSWHNYIPNKVPLWYEPVEYPLIIENYKQKNKTHYDKKIISGIKIINSCVILQISDFIEYPYEYP